eukprot:TRINITY_DN8042_c0_g2_i1.p1 TRINITY_DN8042_c0_g2~~TRINITY_DN8042_c0_g2_i1.p1  ORF type:complete len:277 (+),score=77.08 TRINITY_DN8042_c0_g2_i1:43-831(+)
MSDRRRARSRSPPSSRGGDFNKKKLSYFHERRAKRNALPLDPNLLWLSAPEVELYLMEEQLKNKKKLPQQQHTSSHRRNSEDKSAKKRTKSRRSTSEDGSSHSDNDTRKHAKRSRRSLSPDPDPAVEEEPANPASSSVNPSLTNEEFGPVPLQQKEITERGYGKALLPGEGSAIASFVQAGQRIPRRGEVGLTSDAIEKYETLGYVMSGSRNQRMNAIRIRKENQVIAAEEARAMSLLQFEEKAKKEQKLIADFRNIVEKKS